MLDFTASVSKARKIVQYRVDDVNILFLIFSI
jgi:hypothetical protein